MVDGIHSENVSVVSGDPQRSMLGHILFLLYTCDLPIILENTFVGYADESTLLSKLPDSGSRVPVLLVIGAILLVLVIGANAGD